MENSVEDKTTTKVPQQVEDGEVAIDQALSPLDEGEGPRIGVLGDTGVGKTEALRRIVKRYIERTKGEHKVFIIDDKEAQVQFEGELRQDRKDLKDHPVDSTKKPCVIVFRGDRFSREFGEVDPESIAEIQWGMAQQGKPSLGVYDELDKAASGGQWKAPEGRKPDQSTVRWLFIKGRNSGVATIWGTQETQAVPREAFNQSPYILCFRLVGAPLRLLAERGYLEGGVKEVIETLPGDELPREQRGYFVLLRRGRVWNGKIYRFKKPQNPQKKEPK